MSEHEHYHHECHDDIKCCCHKHEQGHSHDEDHEDENSLKKIIISALFFVAGLVIEHLSNIGSSVILSCYLHLLEYYLFSLYLHNLNHSQQTPDMLCHLSMTKK